MLILGVASEQESLSPSGGPRGLPRLVDLGTRKDVAGLAKNSPVTTEQPRRRKKPKKKARECKRIEERRVARTTSQKNRAL